MINLIQQNSDCSAHQYLTMECRLTGTTSVTFFFFYGEDNPIEKGKGFTKSNY